MGAPENRQSPKTNVNLSLRAELGVKAFPKEMTYGLAAASFYGRRRIDDGDAPAENTFRADTTEEGQVER
jgi:hypothetical protein